MKFRSRALKLDLDMTPMIDITFLLIAFFMMTVNFAEEDQNETIRLPSSELVRPSEVVPKQRMTLQLTNGDTIFLGTAEYPVSQLRSALEFERSYFRALKVNQQDVEVVIRADARGTTGNVLDVMRLCKELGFSTFRLRAKQEEGGN